MQKKGGGRHATRGRRRERGVLKTVKLSREQHVDAQGNQTARILDLKQHLRCSLFFVLFCSFDLLDFFLCQRANERCRQCRPPLPGRLEGVVARPATRRSVRGAIFVAKPVRKRCCLPLTVQLASPPPSASCCSNTVATLLARDRC